MSARRNPSHTVPNPCKHLLDFNLKHGPNRYHSIQDSFRCGPYGPTLIYSSESEKPRCGFCSSGPHARLFMCLICSPSVTVCVTPDSNHAFAHSNAFDEHEIFVDIERAELYCCVCRDQVYDPEFDETVVLKNAILLNGLSAPSDSRAGKRKRLDFGGKKSKSKQRTNNKSCVPLGLRGLNNLGSTCFMNSVLQALVHAPPFRDYFLGDGHDHEMCRKRSRGSVDQLCLPCDLDVVFSAVFSGERGPYSPAKLLYSWWQHSENLASYEQQDAHEFFISMLDRIHEKLGKANPVIKENGDCQCIAHRVFSGMLRSDVTCTSCGFMSSTYDPCVDISLDLNTNGSFSKNPSSKQNKPNETLSASSSLSNCLDRFTRPEKLGLDEKLYCENCQEKQNALKQMSLEKLPAVLCLHIKRFEHSPIRKMSRKIDRHLKFPFTLDMSPYLSTSIIKKRFGNRIFSFGGEEKTDNSTEFEIFAVVTHSGMLESGHYVTYLRLQKQWYKCNDAWVTEVDDEVVRSAQCYLIFYSQKVFYHNNGSEDVGCQPLSTLSDPFVPIAGCC